MKKVLIIISVVFMLIASVSCEKDKSGEMIETYDEFMSVLATCNSVTNINSGYEDGGKRYISKSALEKAVNKINGTEISITTKDETYVLSEKVEDNKKTYTYDNVCIKYKYTEGSDETEKEGSLKIEGSYSREVHIPRGDEAYETEYSYDFTINGKSYKLSYYLNADYTYRSASVYGKGVEIRLLNATVGF